MRAADGRWARGITGEFPVLTDEQVASVARRETRHHTTPRRASCCGPPCPQEGDLLASLRRVVQATRTVVGVDGIGLTLAHEDGQPRWVAVSDAAMELLEQTSMTLRGPAWLPSPRTESGRPRRGPEAEQALQAAQTGLARRTAALDRAQDDLDDRERTADARQRAADHRDRTARDPD